MPDVPDDPRVRFAAEQNFLAWIRTGLAMMGFGFVVARFGLFLRELSAAHPDQPPAVNGAWSAEFGVILVLLGVLVNVLAGLEFRTISRRLERGEPYRPPAWSLGLIVAGLLAALGLAMAFVLIAM